MSTKVINVHEAKTHLSRLLQDAIDGEDIVIARDHVPVVRLEVLDSARPQRTLGWAKGKIEIAPDFDAPLDDFDDYR